MAVLNLDKNATFGENGVGKLYIATDYTWTVYDEGDGSNESTTISSIESSHTFADVGFFENFSITLWQGDTRVITTDYCGVGEISRKSDKVPWFTVDVQEILEMENLSLILGEDLSSDSKQMVMKRTQKTVPYHLFKFVMCEKESEYTAFYFVKTALSADINIPFNNLAREDFTGATLSFETAQSGNFVIDRDYTPSGS